MSEESEPKGLPNWLLPEKVKELLSHVTIDADGKRTITLPNLTITFSAPE